MFYKKVIVSSIFFYFSNMVALANNTNILVQTFIFIVNQSYIPNEDSYNYYYIQIGKESNATKCYGSFGCFNLTTPWTSESRPVSLFPEESLKIEPKYPIYTRDNPTVPRYIDLNEYNYIESSGISFSTPLYLITHGYMEGGNIFWIHNIAQRLLELENCTVIVIDWEGGSNPPYTQAVANIRLLGVMTAHLLNDIATYTNRTNMDDVHCIGHSLGAHLCAYIGYTLQDLKFDLTIGRITGMDPAEPHFSRTHSPVRLDRSAAKYVDVIHTDGSQFIRGGLGMTESIGHVDYYPNGGTAQPGCTRGMFQYVREANGSFFNGLKKYLSCNHIRSHQFFLESITPNPKCKFMTISCPSFQEFVSGQCFNCGRNGENCLPFGYHGRKHYDKLTGDWKNTSRVQYLLTGEESPYCKGHYRIAVQTSDKNESVHHGGEIGQLYFTIHSSSDGKGDKSSPVGFKSGFYEPGKSYIRVVATNEVPDLRAIEIELKYNSTIFNPLTWRFFNTPKVFLKNVTIDALELNKRLTVCPKDQKPLINGIPQLMLSSYC